MADLTTLQAWLTEAQNARHQLATGAAIVEVWRDGRRLTYSKANMADLVDYIGDLQDQIEDLEAALNGTGRTRRRAIRQRWA